MIKYGVWRSIVAVGRKGDFCRFFLLCFSERFGCFYRVPACINALLVIKTE